LGKDSRLTFEAPANGRYLVRVSDVRGFTGTDYAYQLIVRRPQPGFNVTLATKELTVNAGSGKPFVVKVERQDNFQGPVEIHMTGLPRGIHVTTPVIIQGGLYEASGLIYAESDAGAPSSDDLKAISILASATVCGQTRTQEVASFKSVQVGARPKILVQLSNVDPQPSAADIVTLRPGGRATCKLRVERDGFDDRIAFDVANLPHGVIVDDIGLSGVLIPEKQTERTIFLRAEPWVPEQTRTFFATAQVDGNQSSLPLVLHVQKAEP
jgi:hypothetical protein